MKFIFKNKKGIAIPLEMTELILMIIVVVIGVLLLNMVSTANEQSAQDQALKERMNYTMDQNLNMLLVQPIVVGDKTMTLAEAVNNYFALKFDETKYLEDKYVQDKNKQDELEEKILLKINMLKDGVRSTRMRFVLFRNGKAMAYISKDNILYCHSSSKASYDESGKLLPLIYLKETIIPDTLDMGNKYKIVVRFRLSDEKYGRCS